MPTPSRLTIRLLALTAAGTLVGAQDAPLPKAGYTQNKVSEWVKTRQLISEESSSWDAEKASLGELNQVRQKEITQLDEFIAAAGERVADLASQRDTFAAEEAELKSWRSGLESRIAKAEGALLPLLIRFPPPLREKVEESLIRLESPDPDQALQNRSRDVLVVLQAYLEFQNTLTVDADVREINGERREIEILYAGLTQAWYVDSSGNFSGYGYPGAEGWVWVEDGSISARVREAIEIQSRRAMPAFVELPFGKEATNPQAKGAE